MRQKLAQAVEKKDNKLFFDNQEATKRTTKKKRIAQTGFAAAFCEHGICQNRSTK